MVENQTARNLTAIEKCMPLGTRRTVFVTAVCVFELKLIWLTNIFGTYMYFLLFLLSS